MNLASLSRWLEQATRPQHPYYHPLQLTFFASLSYISTAYFTRIPPIRGMTFIISAYTISQLITPFFIQLFEPYQNIALIPLSGQVMQLSLSATLAKIICYLAGHNLSFKEIRLVSTVFLVSLYVSRFALRKLRQCL